MKNTSGEKTARNEILSLISILSIVLVFAAVCGSILALLLQVGALQLPGFLTKETVEEIEKTPTDNILSLLHKENSSKKELYTPEENSDVIKELIVGIVSTEKIYMRLSRVKIDGEKSSEDIFDVWRLGEKFRVVEYDVSGTQKYDIVCDGKNVIMINSDGDEYTLQSMGYYDVSPMPELSSLTRGECNVIYTDSENGEFEAIIDDPEKSEVYDIIISMSDMHLISLKQFKNNTPKTIIEVLLLTDKVDDSSFSQ